MKAAAKTEEEVRRLLRGAPAVIRHMTAHLAKAPGKMIRARALLACALRKDGLDQSGRCESGVERGAAASGDARP